MSSAETAKKVAQQFDCVIVGGGLAGGLIALALHRARPHLRLALVEAGRSIGGNHRWSWFESDLSEDGRALLAGFRKTEWDEGYDVAFPGHARTLATSYRSMASSDFHEGLVRALPAEALFLGRRAESLDANGVDLAAPEYGEPERLEARSVIDCRSFAPSPHLRGGWQVFLGRHMRLAEPHGLTRPMIMDASVDQLAPHGNGGAYRFVYVLPLGAHDVFVEDTYYADAPELDRSALSGRIDQYAQAREWKHAEIVGHEAGVLPVLHGGNFAAYQDSIRIPGVAVAGARGGFTHPLTSYTLPIAVENALAVAREADLIGEQLAAMFEARARRHWSRTAYYRLLAKMLFLAAEPAQRVRVFERFYRLKEGLIERFYAARSRPLDKLRILAGRPPVPIPAAIAALLKRGAPLKTDARTEIPMENDA